MKIGCISVKPVGECFFALPCSSAWWWERSPNYNNSNNFCNVNTNGNANNNNARYSNGLAPDFVNQKWSGSNAVARHRVNHDLYERRDTSRDESPKLPFDAQTRTPPRNRACMAGDVSYPVSCVGAKHIRRYPTRYMYGGRITL